MIIWDVRINGVWIECDYGFVNTYGTFWFWSGKRCGSVRFPDYRLSDKTIRNPEFRRILNEAGNKESYIWEPSIYSPFNDASFCLA